MKRLDSFKSQIIRTTANFNRLFRTGQRYSSSSFLLIISEASQTKFGVAVSSKIPTAVKRNRAKRKTKEIIRLHQALLPAGKEVIVMAKPEAERRRHSVLVQELLGLLQKATQ